MKHKSFLKSISLVLTVLLLFCTASPAVAIAETTFQQSEDPLQQYLNECMTYYLLGQGLDLDANSYYLTQGLDIVNGTDSNKHIYYLFINNTCMGELIVTSLDGEYVSSFMYGEIPAVTQAYRTGAAVSVYVDNAGSSYLWTPNGTTQMSGPESSNVTSISTLDVSMELSPVVLNTSELSLELPAQTYSSSTVENRQLSVPIVSNATNPTTGDGLCWASCVSSISAYLTDTTALTTLEMYNRVYAKIHVSGYTYPVGIKQFIIPAFELFGLEFEYSSGGLEFSDVKLMIQNDSPFYASIWTADGTSRHAVVINGYQKYPGAQIVVFMDPNRSYYVQAYLADDSTNFTYTHNSYTYTVWHHRYTDINMTYESIQ